MSIYIDRAHISPEKGLILDSSTRPTLGIADPGKCTAGSLVIIEAKNSTARGADIVSVRCETQYKSCNNDHCPFHAGIVTRI